MIEVSVISDVITKGVGLTLLNSLWQGLLISLVLSVILWLVPRSRVQLKYWMSVTALAGLIFWTGYSLNNELSKVSGTSTIDQIGIVELVSGTSLILPDSNVLAATRGKLDLWMSYLYPFIDTMVVFWLMGVLFFLLRLQGSMFYLRRLKVMGTHPVPLSWQQKVQELADMIGVVKPVSIYESTLAEIPMVIGHLKPVILIPIGMLTNLSPREVEAILAHELAHIKRFDYLINIVQTVVESLLFFNPAVWWISHTIRKHREHCCDDTAVKYCGNQLEYANALSNLGAWSLKSPALGMGLFKNKNELLMRIKRLVYPQVGDRTMKEKLVPGLVLMLTVLCFSWYSHRVQAQLVPVTAPEVIRPEPEATPLVQSLDTIPEVVPDEEALPPMEPDQVYDTWFDEDDLFEEEVDFNFKLPEVMADVPYEFVMPPMPDMADWVDWSNSMVTEMDFLPMPPEVEVEVEVSPDIQMEYSPQIELEMDAFLDQEQLSKTLRQIHLNFSDTTRERILAALEAEREALERAKKEQAQALEKAQEQLRRSLEADKPDELTEEEWEMAKREISRAERSLERALRESERALDRALEEQELVRRERFDPEVHQQHMRRHLEHTKKHQNRMKDHQHRIHQEVARAQREIHRQENRAIWRHSGNESKLRHQLQEDGLIDNYNADISLSFTRTQIKINGVKLEGAVKEKYRELLDEMYGKNSTGELQFKD